MPLPGFVEALRSNVEPRNKEWYGYKGNETAARGIVASSLRLTTGAPFEPEDVALTNGGFGAIELALQLQIDAVDSAIRDEQILQGSSGRSEARFPRTTEPGDPLKGF